MEFIENAKMYTHNAACGQTVLEHRVVTSYLNGLTLPTKCSVNLHRYALQIRCLNFEYFLIVVKGLRNTGNCNQGL